MALRVAARTALVGGADGALPFDSDGQALRFAGFEPPADSRLLGFVPSQGLQFEHRGGDFVHTASLSAALRHLAES